MSKVDIVYFMKGWENARGCKIENKICQDYGKQTMYNIYEEDQLVEEEIKELLEKLEEKRNKKG